MKNVLNLKNQALQATACGQCQGSSSDAKARPERPTKAELFGDHRDPVPATTTE
jgi:hypothetical protein